MLIEETASLLFRLVSVNNFSVSLLIYIESFLLPCPMEANVSGVGHGPNVEQDEFDCV